MVSVYDYEYAQDMWTALKTIKARVCPCMRTTACARRRMRANLSPAPPPPPKKKTHPKQHRRAA